MRPVHLQRLFRTFLLSDLVLTAGSIAASMVVAGEDPGPESLTYLIAAVTILVAWIAALAGLWRFRNWARQLYVGLAITGLAATVLTGGEAGSGLQDAMNSLCWLVTGAVIALAYWSPLASTFRAGEPTARRPS